MYSVLCYVCMYIYIYIYTKRMRPPGRTLPRHRFARRPWTAPCVHSLALQPLPSFRSAQARAYDDRALC